MLGVRGSGLLVRGLGYAGTVRPTHNRTQLQVITHSSTTPTMCLSANACSDFRTLGGEEHGPTKDIVTNLKSLSIIQNRIGVDIIVYHGAVETLADLQRGPLQHL